MTVRIVPSAPSYIPGFNAVVDAIARERRYLAFVEGPSLDATETFVQSILAGRGVQFLAMDEPARVVGWCDIVRMPFEGFGHVGRFGMGLLPQYRGLGLGRQLAETCLAAAPGAGFERIELEVFASNTRAIRLYEDLGFLHEGVKRRARFLDGRYDDNVLMALFLRSAEPE